MAMNEYPLTDCLSKDELTFVDLKSMNDLVQFAGTWVVLESEGYNLYNRYNVLVGYVNTKPQKCPRCLGSDELGYVVNLLRDGAEEDLLMVEPHFPPFGKIPGQGILIAVKIRNLEDYEKEKIKEFLDKNAHENQKCVDYHCFRLHTDEKHRRITGKDVFDYLK